MTNGDIAQLPENPTWGPALPVVREPLGATEPLDDEMFIRITGCVPVAGFQSSI